VTLPVREGHTQVAFTLRAYHDRFRASYQDELPGPRIHLAASKLRIALCIERIEIGRRAAALGNLEGRIIWWQKSQFIPVPDGGA